MVDRSTWFDSFEVAEVTAEFVRIIGTSGEATAEAVVPRHAFRRYVETSKRQLDAFELTLRDNVVRLPEH